MQMPKGVNILQTKGSAGNVHTLTAQALQVHASNYKEIRKRVVFVKHVSRVHACKVFVEAKDFLSM